MTGITNTTQLSVFNSIRAAILANSTLNKKFTKSNIYQYEPKHKSPSFSGFPYIWIDIPSTANEKIVFNNNFNRKELTVDLYLRMDYLARDNYLSYANAILKAIEDYESTLQASGYYDVSIELIGTDSNQVIQQKEIVEGYFTITFQGYVNR